MASYKVLAIAVSYGRVAYVFFEGTDLKLWDLSVKASKTPALAVTKVRRWIDYLKPDVVVTEDISHRSRKGDKTKSLIEAIVREVERRGILTASVARVQTFKNKFEEAKALAERFPDILPWVPKPNKIWLPEPRNTSYFEAMALVLEVVKVPSRAAP